MSTSTNTQPQRETATPTEKAERKFVNNDPYMDVIFHNMNSASDFTTVRSGGEGSVDDILLEVATHVKDGCYKIVSISASKHSFVVVCSTELSKAELWLKGFPFASTKGKTRPEFDRLTST